MKTAPRLAAAAALILAYALSACANDAEQTPPVTTTQAATVASTSVTALPALDFDSSTLERVDAAQFSRDGRTGFSYTNEGKQAFCAVNADAIVCGGTADDSVPDVTFTSNFALRPNAIGLGEVGLAYTLTEGLPQLNIELRAGQWVDFGKVECAKPSTQTLTCRTSSAAFTIDGAGLKIHTQGTVLDEFAQLTNAQAAETITSSPTVQSQSTNTNVEVTGPFTCDVVPGFRQARIDHGTISCQEAMNIIAHYDSIALAQGTGNTLSVEFDGWLCYSPTAASSQIKGIATGCGNDVRGIDISVPLS
ncbi:hypothetical protein CMUST_02880 [Corynebacterium mustelae]|uniref:Uncharacterized protein n=1 Tax=Corynebacterium mustelae TaxID=571915 RepID=A0A0G3GWL1_9CORY|nr:hypothetical protein [Corynebacterium mustelae]AKK04920.1 hypothetical protein CMUST_02880 [Corynebacterium mustelae]